MHLMLDSHILIDQCSLSREGYQLGEPNLSIERISDSDLSDDVL